MVTSRRISQLLATLLLGLAGCLLSQAGRAQAPLIRPGEVWPDIDGHHIQAHGGILKLQNTSNKYATAPTLAGPWTELKDIAPPETNTYGSQSTMLVKVVGSKKTTVLFLADIWKPDTQWDSRYLWMPLEIGDGQLHLPAPRPFTLNVKTGETTFPVQP